MFRWEDELLGGGWGGSGVKPGELPLEDKKYNTNWQLAIKTESKESKRRNALPQKVITVQRLKIHTDGISVG